MSKDDELGDLIQIIERLEIRDREHDNELRHAKEIVQRLQSRDIVSTAPSVTPFANREESRQFTPIAVPVTSTDTDLNHFEHPLSRIKVYQQDRTRDLARGVNLQLGDWVNIKNPRKGQPHAGEVI